MKSPRATRTGRHTTMTSREFNQHTGEAKKAAEHGPVFISDRGRPAYVLMRAEDYEKLRHRPLSAAQALAHPPSEKVDLDADLPTREIEPLGVDFET